MLSVAHMLDHVCCLLTVAFRFSHPSVSPIKGILVGCSKRARCLFVWSSLRCSFLSEAPVLQFFFSTVELLNSVQ